MSIMVTVKHHFSAGHRIPGLPGAGAKCANIHGHTFGLEWTFRTDSVDVDSIEFTEVKRALRGWVDEKMDHGFIVGADDKETIDLLVSHGSKHYILETPPTTEAIAYEVAINSKRLLPDADLVSVLVTEGPNNEARWIA